MFNKLKEGCRGILRRASIVPQRYWMVILVVVLIGGHALCHFISYPAHLDAIAEEFGNLGYVLKNEGITKNGKPQLNHAGSQILFCRSSEKGMGVFLCDTANGKKKMVFEEKEICFGQGPHGVLKIFPWSPDDAWFIYAHQGSGAANADYDRANETLLTICNAESGQESATLEIPFGQVAALDWLSSDSFVFASGANGQDFYLVNRQADGHWQQRQLDKSASAAKPSDQLSSFVAISGDTVAWLQTDTIWTMNVASNTVEKLIQLPKDKSYFSFDYSKATRKFLISCWENHADSLWQLPLDDPNSFSKVSVVSGKHDIFWNDAVWLNEKGGFAYIVPLVEKNTSGLMVRNNSLSKPVLLFQHENIKYVAASPDGRGLFIIGDLNGQPGDGLWQYDIASKQLRDVSPASEKPLQYSKHIEPQFISFKSINGIVAYPPTGYDPRKHKKYPVVLTSIGFAEAQPYISQYAEAVANAGAYFVIVDQHWNNRNEGITIWETNVYSFYSALIADTGHEDTGQKQTPKQTPASLRNKPAPIPISIDIDKNRIFLLSNSAQSVGLMQLLTQYPGLCNGAIMFVPGGLSEPSKMVSLMGRPLKILVSQQDGRSEEYLKKFQEDASKTGIAMDYIIHPGTPHEFIAEQSQRDRIKAMLHFIFDN
jgi:dienelactone hydrolase